MTSTPRDKTSVTTVETITRLGGGLMEVSAQTLRKRMTMSEDENYEYGIEYLVNGEWKKAHSNRFSGWYDNKKGARNALAQFRATRYGRPARYEYRLVRRPFGDVEVVE